MELKLIDLVRKMEQNNPDLEYFEQGTFTMKPVYMKKSNVIKMETSLSAFTAVSRADVFCNAFNKADTLQCGIYISQLKKVEAELLDIQLYRTLCLPAYAAENIS